MGMRKTSRFMTLLLALLMLLGMITGCGGNIESGGEYEAEALTWDITEYSQFRSEEHWEDHYQKHVIDQDEFSEDFGELTKEQYLMLAQWLMDFADEDVQIKEDDGDTLYYDADNNFFGVMSDDGYIRTFFRPTAGQDYFDRQ